MWISLHFAVSHEAVALNSIWLLSIAAQWQCKRKTVAIKSQTKHPHPVWLYNLCTKAWLKPLAAGCLVHANPSAPEAWLLGHVGMKAASGWHTAQGPGSNPQLGTSISIRMNMSISLGRCWEAEYENRCWWQAGRGRDSLAWMNDGKGGGQGDRCSVSVCICWCWRICLLGNFPLRVSLLVVELELPKTPDVLFYFRWGLAY